jgi:hypothetical protein
MLMSIVIGFQTETGSAWAGFNTAEEKRAII